MGNQKMRAEKSPYIRGSLRRKVVKGADDIVLPFIQFRLAYFNVPERYLVGGVREKMRIKILGSLTKTLAGLLGRPNFILDCRVVNAL